MNRKEQIAQEFVNLHQNKDWEFWGSKPRTLEEVYYNIVGGVYGKVSDNGKGNMIIGISGTYRPDGNPYLFKIESKDYE